MSFVNFFFVFITQYYIFYALHFGVDWWIQAHSWWVSWTFFYYNVNIKIYVCSTIKKIYISLKNHLDNNFSYYCYQSTYPLHAWFFSTSILLLRCQSVKQSRRARLWNGHLSLWMRLHSSQSAIESPHWYSWVYFHLLLCTHPQIFWNIRLIFPSELASSPCGLDPREFWFDNLYYWQFFQMATLFILITIILQCIQVISTRCNSTLRLPLMYISVTQILHVPLTFSTPRFFGCRVSGLAIQR